MPVTPKPPLTFRLWVPGLPLAKQSGRVIPGTSVMMVHKEVEKAEQEIRRRMRVEIRRLGLVDPYLGPGVLSVMFLFRTPGWMVNVPQVHCSRPDGGNLLKLVEDALQGPYGIYLDDSQLNHDKRVMVRYAPVEGTYVRLRLWDGPDQKRWVKAVKKLEHERACVWDRSLSAKKHRDYYPVRVLLKEEGFTNPSDSSIIQS